MQQKKAVVLESNDELRKALEEGLERKGGFRVEYAGDDGEAGLREIGRAEPDVAVVGIFLKGLDGTGVIRGIRKKGLPTKIVATGLGKDSLMEKAIEEGADYYLVKPFSTESAIERICGLLKEYSEAKVSEYAEAKKKATTIEEKISDIFMAIGVPPHIKGYAYLREGIKITVTKPYMINNVTKGLYPGIAEKFGTTPSKVERAIRHAIEVAWNRGRIEAINAVFGTRIYLGTEKPTNSEFIALVADKLILENMI